MEIDRSYPYQSGASDLLARRLAVPFLTLLTAFILAAVTLAYVPRPGYGWLHQLTIIAVVLAGGLGFVLGYRRLGTDPDDQWARRVVLAGAVPLWAAAVCAAPFDSRDLGGYLNCGRVEVKYRLNPYVVPVGQIPDWQQDELLVGYWKDTVCAYGFLFSRLAAVVVTVAGDDRAATFWLFKAVNLVALALTVWLVDGGCRRAGVSRAVGTYLVAWNPLILLHGLANGHNDLLVGLGLVAALVAAQARLWWAVMPALAAAALVKYSTVPLVPLALVFLVRRHGWARAAASATLAGVLVVAAAWAYVADGSALEASRNLANVTSSLNSLGSVIVIPLTALAKKVPAVAPVVPVAATALKTAGGLLVLGTVAVLVWRRGGSTYEPGMFVRDAVLVQCVMIAVASPKFFGWYVLMFWPAVALLPADSRLRQWSLGLAVAQLGSFTFLGRAHVVSPLLLIALPLYLAWRAGRRAATGGCGPPARRLPESLARPARRAA